MYHEPDLYHEGYYDSASEIPSTALVYLPNQSSPRRMTIDEMLRYSERGWITKANERLKSWVINKFMTIRTVRMGNKTGYNRIEDTVHLKIRIYESDKH